MTYKEMLDLIKTINRLELSEFKMKDGEFELTVRTKEYSKTRTSVVPASPTIVPVPQAVAAPAVAPVPQAAPASAPAAAPAKEDADAPADNKTYLEIKSPIVGTFYRSSGPEKPVFVKVGDKVAKGDTVCIVEAMKLFNEIESEISGTIVKVLVEDAQPVEYDQVLFLVEA
ncbi:MAG: acetyl-CoA carboxylase biotin carboxyl carrier protein [Bacteroidota bacterium]